MPMNMRLKLNAEKRRKKRVRCSFLYSGQILQTKKMPAAARYAMMTALRKGC